MGKSTKGMDMCSCLGVKILMAVRQAQINSVNEYWKADPSVDNGRGIKATALAINYLLHISKWNMSLCQSKENQSYY